MVLGFKKIDKKNSKRVLSLSPQEPLGEGGGRFFSPPGSGLNSAAAGAAKPPPTCSRLGLGPPQERADDGGVAPVPDVQRLSRSGSPRAARAWLDLVEGAAPLVARAAPELVALLAVAEVGSEGAALGVVERALRAGVVDQLFSDVLVLAEEAVLQG